MAKRMPKDSKTYRPVSEALVQSVLRGGHGPTDETAQVATMGEEDAPEPTRRPDVVNLGERRSARAAVRDKLEREKRVLLTIDEELAIEEVVHGMAGALGTTLKLSHVIRGCLSLIRHSEEDLVKRCQQAAPMNRPPNGNPLALAEWEDRIARILFAGFRSAPPLPTRLIERK